MKCADVGRPVAEECDADSSGLKVLGGQACPDGRRQMTADDGVRAEDTEGEIGQVHRSALAAAQPPGAPEKLAEGTVEPSAHGEHHPVTAVGAGGRVAGLKHAADPDRHRLLTLAEMRAAAEEPPGEHGYVDVRGASGSNGARFDGDEVKPSVRIREAASETTPAGFGVWWEPTIGVGLEDLDDGVGDRIADAVEDLSGDSWAMRADGDSSLFIVADGKLHPFATMSSYGKALEWLVEHEPPEISFRPDGSDSATVVAVAGTGPAFDTVSPIVACWPTFSDLGKGTAEPVRARSASPNSNATPASALRLCRA